MDSSTLRPYFTPGKDTVPISQEAGWATGPVLTGRKSRPHRDSIPDRPARSSVPIPTELPGPQFNSITPHILCTEHKQYVSCEVFGTNKHQLLTFENRYVFVIQKQSEYYEAGIEFYSILGEF